MWWLVLIILLICIFHAKIFLFNVQKHTVVLASVYHLLLDGWQSIESDKHHVEKLSQKEKKKKNTHTISREKINLSMNRTLNVLLLLVKHHELYMKKKVSLLILKTEYLLLIRKRGEFLKIKVSMKHGYIYYSLRYMATMFPKLREYVRKVVLSKICSSHNLTDENIILWK